MRVIQPNCRVQFTADDVQFILSTLNRDGSQRRTLQDLLADEDTRNLILDDDALHSAIQESTGCLRISDHLYFYVLVRRVLRDSGIDDREVADYVAELLCEFSRDDRTRASFAGGATHYLFEMMAALQGADDRTRFLIRAHMGNQALFLAGVFLERIRYRAEFRGFPDVSYYEQLGQSSFRVASDHRLAERYSLGTIFSTLADRFQETRRALNDVTQRALALGDSDPSVDLILRRN